MCRERKDEPDLDFTDEELDVYGDFSDAVLGGKNPVIEEYMKRAPGSGARLKSLLEGEVLVSAEVARLRADYPGVNLARLLDPDWRSRRK